MLAAAALLLLAALAVGLALGLAFALMLRSKRGRADDPPQKNKWAYMRLVQQRSRAG